MGVTIHFEGKLKSPKAWPLLMDELRDYAAAREWPCETISKEKTLLKRVRNEQDWDYTGPTFGLQLQPHPDAEPLRFEFDEDFYVQEFTKTQFAGVETHIAMITLLRRIQPFFELLSVEDEGEYWNTSDEAILWDRFEEF